MNARFENMMLEEGKKKEERKSIVSTKPKKLDLSSKFSDIQNVLAGRLSMGGNVFTMPTGGIKTIKTSEIEKKTEKKNSILKELINLRDNDNYLETLEKIIEKIEGENYILKQKALILSEHIKKLNIESEELKKESLILKNQ